MKLHIYQSPLLHLEGKKPPILRLTCSRLPVHEFGQFRDAEIESPKFDHFLLDFIPQLVKQENIPETTALMVPVNKETLNKNALFQIWRDSFLRVLDEVPNPLIIAFSACADPLVLRKRADEVASIRPERLYYCLDISRECESIRKLTRDFKWNYLAIRSELLSSGIPDVSEAMFEAGDRGIGRIVSWIESKVALTIATHHGVEYVHGSIFSEPYYPLTVVETVKGLSDG
ncbi:hypothetical protein [Hydrocarboniclastica marina]|uniref:EAL domain-containing protein n=1 Tax=Hydrocarboniclastica marina TaxID=2259620 RepID=A0A4P7XMX0_9ALTE|nr:hypothetical protein [Hydrocarboniclastica marina]QCF28144.1 hypothetical protein soil367_18915 [Hydrocarboniclastica marina]